MGIQREMLKGVGTRAGSHSPLTQLVLIALRKCLHIAFNPINPERIVKMSGGFLVYSGNGVLWVRSMCVVARASSGLERMPRAQSEIH